MAVISVTDATTDTVLLVEPAVTMLAFLSIAPLVEAVSSGCKIDNDRVDGVKLA